MLQRMLGLVYLSEKESLTFLTGQAHFVHKWSRLNGSMVIVIVIVVVIVVIIIIVVVIHWGQGGI